MKSSKQVRKAVIPAAGYGTRMFPASKGIKKEFFPIIDQDGIAKPIILMIVEEAINAGIEEIGIVVQPGDQPFFESFFKNPPQPQLWQKLSSEKQDYSQYLQHIGEHITCLTQETQEGYGHAVFCAADWVNQEPFLLLLGDHIYTSYLEINCAKQLLNIYNIFQQNVIGLRTISGDVIHHYGLVTGDKMNNSELFSLTQIAEKPTLDYAQTHLSVEGLDEDQFLAIFGLYILEPEIFEILHQSIQQNQREKNEFQLTTCLETLRKQQSMIGYLIQGQCYDTGLPQAYRQTLLEFGTLADQKGLGTREVP